MIVLVQKDVSNWHVRGIVDFISGAKVERKLVGRALGLAVASCILFGGAGMATATASLITFTYDSSVVSTGVPTFNIGDPFHLTFTFDSSTVGEGDATVETYYALTALSYSVGSYSGYVSPFTNVPIQVGYNDTGQGAAQTSYSIIAFNNINYNPPPVNGPTVDGWSPYQFVFQLQDPTNTAFTSDALPLIPPNPADFVSQDTYMSLTFASPGGAYSEVFTDFAPEPASLAIIGLGATMLLVRRRKNA
jgi:hypothetical protein